MCNFGGCNVRLDGTVTYELWFWGRKRTVAAFISVHPCVLGAVALSMTWLPLVYMLIFT